MSAPFRDILAVAISPDGDAGALNAAACLARVPGVHATLIALAVHVSSDYAETVAPLSAVLEDLARGPRNEAAAKRAAVEAWAAQSGVSFELRALQIEDALHDRQVLAHARHADITIMTKPNPRGDVARAATWQSVLFGSGRPLILMPSDWRGDVLGRRILVAWNAKREASRAVGDAMPLLAAAERVVVATVDAIPSGDGHDDIPGRALALHLARHGAKAEVMNLDGFGRPAGERLLEAARDAGADLIVMGGYGHARAAEWLLGGVTHDMIAMAHIPLLMSH